MSTRKEAKAPKRANSRKNNKSLSAQNSIPSNITRIRGGNPIPVAIEVKMPYVQNINFDPTSGTPVANFMNLTGLYDPDNTGTGHQPLGYDQYMAQYNSYCVISATWDVTMWSQNAATTGQGMVIVGITDDSSASLDPSTLLEQPTYRLIPLGSIGSTHDIVRFHGKLDIAKNYGLKRSDLLASTAHCGTVSAIPADNAFLQIVFAANNTTVNPDNVIGWIKLEYTCVLSERKELAQS